MTALLFGLAWSVPVGFGEHVGTRASLGVGAVVVTVALPVWLLLRPSDEAARLANETAWEFPAPE